jgi:hypothetical protein
MAAEGQLLSLGNAATTRKVGPGPVPDGDHDAGAGPQFDGPDTLAELGAER